MANKMEVFVEDVDQFVQVRTKTQNLTIAGNIHCGVFFVF